MILGISFRCPLITATAAKIMIRPRIKVAEASSCNNTTPSNITRALDAIADYERSGGTQSISDYLADAELIDAEDDDLAGLGDFPVGKKVQISLADMDLPSWKHDLEADLVLIEALVASMEKVEPADDAKLQNLMALLQKKISEPLNPGNRKVLIFTALPTRPTTSMPILRPSRSSWGCMPAR